MMRKTKLFTLFILLSFTALLFSCGKNSSGLKGDGKPAVTVKSQHMNDNSSFTMSNGERCTIVADATIDYPVSAGDGVAIDSLQRLFASVVLESGDSLSLQEARAISTRPRYRYSLISCALRTIPLRTFRL